jgi:hypothetical protein
MPGIMTIDVKQTFTSMFFVGADQKMNFDNPDLPDITKNGEKKYAVDVTVSYRAEEGRKPVRETITVGIIGELPGIPDGARVEFDVIRVGVSAAAVRANGKGVSGGRMWFAGDGLRLATPAVSNGTGSKPSFGKDAKPAENAA